MARSPASSSRVYEIVGSVSPQFSGTHYRYLTEIDNEKEREDKIFTNFEKFLSELGQDFSILGRQVPAKIDRQTHFIDMVLYHRGIPCVVLVDLKIGKLDSRDIGQMNKYIGFWRRNKQYEHEQPTIGLIICREAGREEVIYALDGLEEKIFIAKYKVKLPSEMKIKKVIKKFWNTKGTGVKSWSVTNIGFLITNQDATPIFVILHLSAAEGRIDPSS